MKTLVLANQKGGVGKTAVATLVAHFLAQQGRRVLAVDFDHQGNFSSARPPRAPQPATRYLCSTPRPVVEVGRSPANRMAETVSSGPGREKIGTASGS
jgi:hypothetical protein